MKKLLLLLLIFCSQISFSQKKIIDTIASQKLKGDREIIIGLPPSYEKNKSQTYPMLLLFDGDFLFDAFNGALSYGYYWDDLPEVIIVGISQNKNDERETDCKIDETNGLPTETGEDFFEFIGMELIPTIQKNYRVAPFRIAAGLDVTAAFMNCYLYKETPIFNAFISLSPELATGMEEQVPERLAAIQKPLFYYHSIAEGDVKKMRDRTIKMDQEIKKISKPTLNYLFEDFKGTSHYSMVLHAIPSALYQIFSVYQPISTAEFNDKIVKLESGYVEYLKKKYEVLEQQFGLKLQIRINDFKAIEAAIMKNKAYNEFDELAQLAEKSYPKTMLHDYEMALMYEMKGDNAKAVRYYMNAFQLAEVGDLTKDMMINRADELKATLPKKGKKGEKVQETPVEEVPTDAPAETPSETPTEEKKSE